MQLSSIHGFSAAVEITRRIVRLATVHWRRSSPSVKRFGDLVVFLVSLLVPVHFVLRGSVAVSIVYIYGDHLS